MLGSEACDFKPDTFSKPADTLLAIISRRNLTVDAVAHELEGGMRTMRGLVTGTQAIDASLARSLSVAVGGSQEFWLKRQASYERALDVALHNALEEIEQWLSYVPAPAARPAGRLSESQKLVQLRERLAFYDVNSLKAWHARYVRVLDKTQFRTSATFHSKDGPLSLWLRRGELEAALTTTEQWNPLQLRALISNILKLSAIRQPSRFLPKLKKLGAKAGVAIVVVRAPEGCRASGASRLVKSDKAMVLLSFRHLSNDHFWFTLLHELGHLLLHRAEPFVDADDTYLDEKEREANKFAASAIVPPERWEEFANLRHDTKTILKFSASLGVAPGLIVGQLQNKGAVPPNRLNFLKRRWTWDEVESALVNL